MTTWNHFSTQNSSFDNVANVCDGNAEQNDTQVITIELCLFVYLTAYGKQCEDMFPYTIQ